MKPMTQPEINEDFSKRIERLENRLTGGPEMPLKERELSTKEPGNQWPHSHEFWWFNFYDRKVISSRNIPEDLRCILIEHGGCFRTELEAEAYRAWLTSPVTQARRRMEGLDGYSAMGQYYLALSIDGVSVGIIQAGMVCGGLSFDTREQAEAALSTHEADIRLVLTGDTGGVE